VFIGLADVSIAASNAVGVSGWSIASHSRTFNKQGGGGTTWGRARTFVSGDVIGCVYDSDLGSLTFYKNKLMGTSTTAVTGDVELMLCGTLPGQ
jgi:hypothetical protein